MLTDTVCGDKSRVQVGDGVCRLTGQWVTQESQIGGHGFSLGLSQSRETDNRQNDDGQRTD